jgi:hypothetical protein
VFHICSHSSGIPRHTEIVPGKKLVFENDTVELIQATQAQAKNRMRPSFQFFFDADLPDGYFVRSDSIDIGLERSLIMVQ